MSKVKAIPEGMHSVTPHLVCAGAADAIDFCQQTFGATELARLPGPGGKLILGWRSVTVDMVAKSGHWLMDEQPDSVVDVILRHTSSASPTAPPPGIRR